MMTFVVEDGATRVDRPSAAVCPVCVFGHRYQVSRRQLLIQKFEYSVHVL